MADYFDVLFNKRKPFVPISVSGGTTNGRIIPEKLKIAEKHLDESEKLMYEEDVKIMKRELKQNLMIDTQTHNAPASDQPIDDIYKKYNFGYRTQAATQLPVHAFKSNILSKIAEFPSVVIEGSTGCGKSTQVNSLNDRIISFGDKF